MKIEDKFLDLCDYAIKRGGTRVKLITANEIVVDERVQLKCRFPILANNSNYKLSNIRI